MSEINLLKIIEGALMAAGKPLSVARMAELFDESERPDNEQIRTALVQIGERCDERGFELREVASGFRFQVRQELSPWVARLWHERPQKYSRALLETLALIAYRQPITRGEIEEIRGVAVSSNIIKTLHEREWVRVVGHRDVPGRPAMYATTRQFLDYFNLKNLDQLPALAEIRDLETLNTELGFSGSEPVAANDAAPESPETVNENTADESSDDGRGDTVKRATEDDTETSLSANPADSPLADVSDGGDMSTESVLDTVSDSTELDEGVEFNSNQKPGPV
ncbi:MAG: SMC-Scp complex subunit ScpB [Parahaliea sp.]